MKKTRTKVLLASLLCSFATFGFTACDWDEFKTQIDTTIAGLTSKSESLESSVGKINVTLEEMKATDTSLKNNIDGLTTRVTALEAELVDVNAKITSLQTDSATKEQLETVKTSLQNQIDSLNAEITALKAKDEELQGKITALQNSLTSEITDVKSWAEKTFLSIENWNTEKAKIESDITALNNKIGTIESTLETMNTVITALQQQVEQNKQDIADLIIRVNCLEGKHAYDRTQITYMWSDNWQFCEFSIPCKHCGATWENSTANLSYDNFKLSAIFDQKDNVEPAVLDISDAREFTVDEITMAVSRMISNGEADNVEVKLTLADDADGAIFAAIVEGMANAEDGTVNLILSGVDTIPDQAFIENAKLKSVTLGDGVKTIGIGSFAGCSSLEAVTFGKDLKTIGEQAFYNSKLKSIIIPDNVTSIRDGAFYGCSALDSVTIGSGINIISDQMFVGCESLQSITFRAPITYCVDPFRDCTKENITLIFAAGQKKLTGTQGNPDTEFELKEDAEYLYGGTEFCGSTFKKIISTFEIDATEMDNPTIKEALENLIGKGVRNIIITLPDAPSASMFSHIKAGIANAENGSVRLTLKGNLTSIPEQAFIESKAIGEIVLPESVTNIGKEAFWGCAFLTSVTFEEGSKLECIEAYAFRACKALTSITLPESLTSIEEYAFYECSALKTVTFGENSKLECIGEKAFYDCTALTEITIPASVKSIGKIAFASCTALKSVTFADNCALTSIPYAMFQNTALESVNFGENSSITSIVDWAFAYCTKLASLTIPAGVTSIGYGAFFGCESLSNLTFEGVLTEIGTDIFHYNVDTSKITLTLTKGQKNFTATEGDYFAITDTEVVAGTNQSFCGYTFKEIKFAEE